MHKALDELIRILLQLFIRVSGMARRPERARRTEMAENVDVEPMNIDLDTVTHQCVCGSKVWKLLAAFEDYELAWYSITMYCASCGARALAPTPLDRPETSEF
jgi:hypothetical protein